MSVSMIGVRLKAVRSKLKLSQRDFSKGIYLSHSFYAKIERGEQNPNERIFELISNKYNVNKKWLVSGKGDMFVKEPPDVELNELMEIINELEPLFKDYIIQQIKLFAQLHRKNKEESETAK